jgi:glycosyltransferase involved in cell wall biosynthesis
VEVEKNPNIEIEAEAVKVKPFVVVGIPAFNEERTIAKVILESQRSADKVVVCDDGSADLTSEIAERLGADVVKHERNLGYGVTIQSLFKRARELNADVLVTLDADGQHDAREIPSVLKPVVEGRADVVIGSRFVDARKAGDMPFYRRFGVKVITKVLNGSAKNGNGGVTDAQSGFRAYSRKALDRLSMYEDGMGASVEILLNAARYSLKICEVSASCHYVNRNRVENSTEHPVKHGIGVVMSIVRYIVEEKPLTLLGMPGILCIALGAMFGTWMLQIYASEHRIVTNIALASIGFIIIGIFAVSTAITLYAITRIADKIQKTVD